ncbi:carbohydrate-binding module family 13 protein [Rhizophagus clarus]|uniref:Carbohydrate-binding module family 13 protein n=1 Tax=Rhizophagus clarus TaxID=94130 RepID=A0A8H3KYZ0_9GLOM|nr:carbohydrate-binding module family 13 protein [Rhizophagus clarus]
MINHKLLPKLSQNLLEILDDNEYYDITIEVGNDPHVKIFRANIAILNHRSPYLRRILSTNKKNNEGTLAHIKLPNILPEIFNVILRYIYGGILSLEEYDVSDIIKILVTANELGLQELFPYIETFLIENKTDWMEQNLDLIYRTSFENNSFLQLQKYCTDLISKEPSKIFNSPNFSSIPEKLLLSLIQNENAQMNEVQVWDYVIKWGLAQNPELSTNTESYSKDDFNVLKDTLQQCIPLIRFHNLTSKEFLDNVVPYKKIIPKELYKDLLKDFLNNNSRPTKNSSLFANKDVKEIHSMDINSKIISLPHIEIVMKWINRLKITDKLTNPYNNQSHTVAFIKVKDSAEILGGYNPIKWKFDNSFGITKESFIFSFRNNNYTLSRVMDERKAIDNSAYYGLSFGNGDLCLYQTLHELRIRCKQTSYEKPIRESNSNYTVREFKVFQIVQD